jgi:hypothetical protein
MSNAQINHACSLAMDKQSVSVDLCIAITLLQDMDDLKYVRSIFVVGQLRLVDCQDDIGTAAIRIVTEKMVSPKRVSGICIRNSRLRNRHSSSKLCAVRTGNRQKFHGSPSFKGHWFGLRLPLCQRSLDSHPHSARLAASPSLATTL